MADMTQQGPQTTIRVEPTSQAQATGVVLSNLSVAPSFMEAETTRLPSHTSESVEQRWNRRQFDTGAVIECRRIGRAV